MPDCASSPTTDPQSWYRRYQTHEIKPITRNMWNHVRKVTFVAQHNNVWLDD